MSDSQKVYSLNTGEGRGPIMTDVQTETCHGIPCIKGRSVAAGNWTESATVYVPISEIKQMVVFDSIEAYREGVARHGRRKTESGD